uniref:3'-5' exonuclease domain-containing protein n=1 Tax=Glossina brevipalpis TaxID=37001 RepID=A0A1A9WQ40_9MUSC
MLIIVIGIALCIGLLYAIFKYQNYLERCEHDKPCDEIVNTLRKYCSNYKVLGFDCEWVSQGRYRNRVALLQLASSNGFCGLFHLCRMRHIPKSLKTLLEDKEIIKVGVEPAQDAQKLKEDYNLYVASTFDVRYFAIMIGCKPLGLEKLSRGVLNVELNKPWSISASNWEAEQLSIQQIQYAANDAFAGLYIFKHLANRLRPMQWEIEIKDFFGSPFIELFAQQKKKNFSRSEIEVSPSSNCRIEGPNGELLCNVMKSKAEWYLERKLGEKIQSEPITVRLYKEPACKQFGHYTIPNAHLCAICSDFDAFIRKPIVPMEYRKHFTVLAQFYSSDDVKRLCYKCNRLSAISDIQIHNALSLMCNAPPSYEQVGKQSQREWEFKKTLLRHGYETSEELESFIKTYFKDGSSETMSEDLGSEHGVTVVKKFQTIFGGLNNLEMLCYWKTEIIDFLELRFVEHHAQKKDFGRSGVQLGPSTNCRIEGPNGELLCNVEKSKAEWYLENGLGKKIQSEPITVRLYKEPACKQFGHYRIPNDGFCEMCFDFDAFIRKPIVPMEYRKHFPVLAQFHSSNDVKILCYKCDSRSDISDIQVHNELSLQCDASPSYEQRIKQEQKEFGYKKGILYYGWEIMFIKAFSMDDGISSEKISESSYFGHGKTVVEKFQTRSGSLFYLEKVWVDHYNEQSRIEHRYNDYFTKWTHEYSAVIKIC